MGKRGFKISRGSDAGEVKQKNILNGMGKQFQNYQISNVIYE